MSKIRSQVVHFLLLKNKGFAPNGVIFAVKEQEAT